MTKDEITDLLKLLLAYQLKNVDRSTHVGLKEEGKKRKESSAEHSWSCLILADFLIEKYQFKVNRQKVFDLLIYHDLVESITGDVCVTKEGGRENKKEIELKAFNQLSSELPKSLAKRYIKLFHEYENQESIEAKFAKAIDVLDPIIQELGYKEDFEGWTESFLRKIKEPYLKEFPELMELFNRIVDYLLKEEYISRE